MALGTRRLASLLVAAVVVAAPTAAVGALGPPSGAAQAAAGPRCDGLRATIVGTARDDRLRGTPRRDVIVGLGGDDRIDGRGGDDVVCGGDGADTLLGGAGDDRVESGRQGRDVNRSGTIAVPDVVEGGPGDDVLVLDRDRRPVADGVSAVQVSFRHSRSGVRVDLGAGTARGEGRDRIRGRAAVVLVGSPRDDRLTGSPGDDVIHGGTGDDVVTGLGGDDELSGDPLTVTRRLPQERDVVSGGDGSDTLDADTGRDVLHGDAGDDLVRAQSREPVEVHGDDGDDQVVVSLPLLPGFVLDGGAGTDRGSVSVAGGSTTDPGPTLVVRTGAGTVVRGAVTGTTSGVESWEFADELAVDFWGTDAPDTVQSGAYFGLRASTYGGDDVVRGSGRDDVVEAGAGQDTVAGFGGTDTCLDAEVTSECEVLTR